VEGGENHLFPACRPDPSSQASFEAARRAYLVSFTRDFLVELLHLGLRHLAPERHPALLRLAVHHTIALLTAPAYLLRPTDSAQPQPPAAEPWPDAAALNELSGALFHLLEACPGEQEVRARVLRDIVAFVLREQPTVMGIDGIGTLVERLAPEVCV